jgi:hypothetical protein
VFGTASFRDWARESGSVVCVGRRVRHCVQVSAGGRSQQDATLYVLLLLCLRLQDKLSEIWCHASKGGAPRNQMLVYLTIEHIGDKNRHFVVRKVSRELSCATLASLALLLRYCRSPVGLI